MDKKLLIAVALFLAAAIPGALLATPTGNPPALPYTSQSTAVPEPELRSTTQDATESASEQDLAVLPTAAGAQSNRAAPVETAEQEPPAQPRVDGSSMPSPHSPLAADTDSSQSKRSLAPANVETVGLSPAQDSQSGQELPEVAGGNELPPPEPELEELETAIGEGIDPESQQAPAKSEISAADAIAPESIEPDARAQETRPPAIATTESDVLTPDDNVLFPTSAIIETQKEFWIGIFSEVTSRGGLIHDGAFTAPIYEELDLRDMSRRNQRRLIRKRKKTIAANLRGLAKTLRRGATPTGQEARLFGLFPHGTSPRDFRKAAAEVRFQRGLADRFEQGLIKSGSYLAYIRNILDSEGVPRDLSFLPHVESSYNYRAYSKYGAAGIWQFTRSTGKQFMNVNYVVDDRLDPIIATRAAAKFLRQNYERFKSWPLAITAYNHGPNSLDRIVTRKGTNDLGELIRTYNGRLFKFASKNFYAEFLAAREVATHYERYFGTVAINAPLKFKLVKLPSYLALAQAVQTLGLDAATLEALNPSLRRPVLLGDKLIPRGFALRLPHHVDSREFLAAIPKTSWQGKQKRLRHVRVSKGDTLYDIGRRYRIPWRRIARANNISSYHRIRPGQRLIIPGPGEAIPVAVAVAAPARKRPAPPARVPTKKMVRVAAYTPKNEGAESIDAFAFQPAEGLPVFPDLDVESFDSGKQVAIIRSAFGETLGHYAAWASVATQEIRAMNRLGYRSSLGPGRRIRIPVGRLGLGEFTQQRVEYHNTREVDFYSYYGVVSSESVTIRRGDSIWSIAQTAGIPMWLMYRENPKYLSGGLRAGMKVQVPIVEELSVLKGLGKSQPDKQVKTAAADGSQ